MSATVSLPDADLTRLQFVAMSARLRARTAKSLVQEDRAEAAREPGASKALRRRADRIEPLLAQAYIDEVRTTAAFCDAFERALRAGKDVSAYAASYGRLRAGSSPADTTYGALKAVVLQEREPRHEVECELAPA